MPAKGYRMKGAKRRSVYQRKFNMRKSSRRRNTKRVADRRRAMKAGRVRKYDGKDLDHRSRRNLSYGSTRVVSRKANRSKNSPLSKKRRKRRRRR